MLNQTVIVGRLIDEPKKIEKDGKKCVEIKLAVNRSYKNEEGIYETDFIPCILWNTIGESTCEYCRKGDVIGIKGRLECSQNKPIELIADKVTFLSSSQKAVNE